MASHRKGKLTGKVSGETDPAKVKKILDDAKAENEAARNKILKERFGKK